MGLTRRRKTQKKNPHLRNNGISKNPRFGIKSSIRTIISWPLHTREYVDEFGSRIHEALEDQNDEVLITLVKKFIIDSITKWDRRVELKKMTFARPNNERLVVDLLYYIKDINIEDTLTYTFYTN